MRIATIGVVAVLSLALAVFGIASQADIPPDDHLMQRTENPVVFPHTPHGRIDCAVCHHTVLDDGSIDLRSCAVSGCHDNFDRRDRTSKSYYNILHGRNLEHPTCISCHIEVAGDDRERRRELTACRNSVCHGGADEGES
jgi:hypothetical protein